MALDSGRMWFCLAGNPRISTNHPEEVDGLRWVWCLCGWYRIRSARFATRVLRRSFKPQRSSCERRSRIRYNLLPTRNLYFPLLSFRKYSAMASE